MKNVMTKKSKRIFLLIGLTKESAHWDDSFVEKLKELYQTENVVAMDLPGAGKYLNMASPLSITGIVSKTRDHYQDYFKDSEKFENILVAISLGGMVAAQWLKLFSNDFSKFVIVNSSFKGLSPVYKRVQPKAVLEFLKIFKTKDNAKREDLVIKLCGNNSDNYEAIHRKWTKIADERPMTKLNMLKQTLAGARFKPDYRPQIPTLIIASRHDRLAHHSCSENLQKVWNGDFHMIEEVHIGHGVHIDAPIELAQIIYEWSEKNISN
jgi:pimeloyl-ACP methyl ester carboxylesterase